MGPTNRQGWPLTMGPWNPAIPGFCERIGNLRFAIKMVKVLFQESPTYEYRLVVDLAYTFSGGMSPR